MNLTFFSTQTYDIKFFNKENQGNIEIHYLQEQLNENTASLAKTEAICVFVNDKVNANVLQILHKNGVKLIALRCAGFNNIDLNKARELGIKIVRVPAYSPQAVAEHAVAMIMTLNRKTHKAFNRVREQNFSLNGLLGFDLFGKTVGVVGTGNIGKAFVQIMKGFGCHILAHDLNPDSTLQSQGVKYVDLETIWKNSDIISLHCPLNEGTKYIISEKSLEMMKQNVMIINTSRGGLVDTKAVLHSLKSKKLHSIGIDVYEQEENLFFRDLSDEVIQDDVITRLMSFPNVLVTAHQGFFTGEALTQIAQTTLSNITRFFKDGIVQNGVD